MGTLGDVSKRPQSFSRWDRLAEAFEEWLKVGAYSKHTVVAYGRAVRRFAAWVEGEGCAAPTALTPELCMAYQRDLYHTIHTRGGAYSVASQIQLLSPVRSFTKFLKKAGHALVDPGLAISIPRAPRRLPRGILSEEEMARLLAAPDARTLRGYRDRAILEVLYGTGIRSGELVALDVEDADLSAARLRIRLGKGKKDRVVPMGDAAAEYVGGYLERIRPRFVVDPGEKAMFLGWRGGKRLSASSVTNDVARYIRRAGIGSHVVLHTFRHTCATHMLKGGAGIRHIQEMLGHESLATTERYTKVEIGDLAEVHARCHPREKI